MADEGQDRTEEPTPRKREEARKQGQVAFSPDLVGSALLVAGVVAIMNLGPGMADDLHAIVRAGLTWRFPAELGPEETRELLLHLFLRGLRLIGPLLGILLAVSIAASLLQVGFHITPERLELKFEKLSPAEGLPRLFSLSALVKGLFALVKVTVLAAIVFVVVRPRIGLFGALGTGGVETMAELSWQLTMRLALYIAGAFVIIGVADFVYQRYRLEQSLRMTRQELKEEMKREEGDPLIRARMRQMQRELGRRRMLAEVPKATVVITNPTHVAVALRYDRTTMRAPKVVAKGAGLIARRIAETARRHSVPVIERPTLARAVYRTVDEDQEVPPQLFVAVAEVIAFVYRLRGTA